ncbi:1-deoxy-D-xylulose-5-phosphate synthase [Propionispora vibrioides]|uniref:1-deoxy-D-xylulose-5-phosphate synthase n=1 Tax=Propionispora vibrioides TaxID=112903 RepID=A0A1H8SHQ0_9FIRM|nr:1-deoxy-D-xylulose-5-phosphate synthase [Propionispora vibrioides]SEO77894.1 1-deoxy-D-xylulose-5-phosphate synthase [Propionispora vibrioides]
MHTFLERVNSPQDIKKLTFAELTLLAGEIRSLIIETVARSGGHLAPNLGVVELTLALHKVFDSPQDKMIWDVGHQSYVHKILTGRGGALHELRQMGGISGFPKRSESEHDAFATGHASTSISAAVGMAVARDMSGQDNHVLAVIGDGSLTGGEAYEALNHAGHIGTKLIVVLNDNEMSIARNVGAMSGYLAKIRTAPGYAKVKQDLEHLLRRIPSIGDRMVQTAERLKDSVRHFFIPGMLFEELGFTYLGPIDGHDLADLTGLLEKAKQMSGPVVLHVLTRKGKGYAPAERNADIFHGVGPFHAATGEIIKKDGPPTYTRVFGDTLLTLAEADKNIAAITAAMPEGTGLKAFAGRFPARFFDVGIAEPHAVTMAAAMACEGKKPVIALYSTFGQRAYDQVLHDVCLQELPVVLALDRAGLVGEDGPTHHGVFDYSYLRHIPNLICMAPKDEGELRHMLYTALQGNRPVALRYPRGSGIGIGVDLSEPLQVLPVGQAEVLRLGRDVNLVAIGSMVNPCQQAAAQLQEQGIDAGVVNARFVKPLDRSVIHLLAETGPLITVEENVLAGGFGSAVLECLSDQGLAGSRVLRLGLPDEFIEHGAHALLLKKYGLDANGIARQTAGFLRKLFPE